MAAETAVIEPKDDFDLFLMQAQGGDAIKSYKMWNTSYCKTISKKPVMRKSSMKRDKQKRKSRRPYTSEYPAEWEEVNQRLLSDDTSSETDYTLKHKRSCEKLCSTVNCNIFDEPVEQVTDRGCLSVETSHFGPRDSSTCSLPCFSEEFSSGLQRTKSYNGELLSAGYHERSASSDRSVSDILGRYPMLRSRSACLGDKNLNSPTDFQIYRVRSFTTTSGAIINKGDSFKVRSPQRSSPNLTDSKAYRESFVWTNRGYQCSVESLLNNNNPPIVITDSDDVNLTSYPPYDKENSPSLNDISDKATLTTTTAEFHNYTYDCDSLRDNDCVAYNVLVLGARDVGKTTMCQQLMTSDYLQNCDMELDDDDPEKFVTVLIDGEETGVRFLDTASEEAYNAHNDVDAHIIVYDVTNRNSFNFAHACLQDIKRNCFSSDVVILVANKMDLVRNREVSEEDGKALATKWHCKYIEVSAILDHKIDELLVGVTRQMRLSSLRQLDDHNSTSLSTLYGGCLQKAAFQIFRRLFRKQTSNSKNCDNLLCA